MGWVGGWLVRGGGLINLKYTQTKCTSICNVGRFNKTKHNNHSQAFQTHYRADGYL